MYFDTENREKHAFKDCAGNTRFYVVLLEKLEQKKTYRYFRELIIIGLQTEIKEEKANYLTISIEAISKRVEVDIKGLPGCLVVVVALLTAAWVFTGYNLLLAEDRLLLDDSSLFDFVGAVYKSDITIVI